MKPRSKSHFADKSKSPNATVGSVDMHADHFNQVNEVCRPATYSLLTDAIRPGSFSFLLGGKLTLSSYRVAHGRLPADCSFFVRKPIFIT
jgi:hypothetical protein